MYSSDTLTLCKELLYHIGCFFKDLVKGAFDFFRNPPNLGNMSAGPRLEKSGILASDALDDLDKASFLAETIAIQFPHV